MGPTPNGELTRVASDEDWDAYHEIRERVLWEARGRVGEYDRDHPDEHADGNHPFLLVVDGRPVGVLRIDIRPPVAWLRRVAVREHLQRRGHGRLMLQLAMHFARENGCTEARSNVDPDAVAFYRKLGFTVVDGDDDAVNVPMSRSF